MAVRYEFLVARPVSDTVRAAFPELTVAPGPVGGTAFFGWVPDDAAVIGFLARFADLAIPVVEMRRLPD